MKRSAAHSNTAKQHSNTAKQHSKATQQSNTATHAHYQHTAAHGNQRARYTQLFHSAAATYTTPLHSQRARHHGSNTQRRRGIAHPLTTASSNIECSVLAHSTFTTVPQSLSALTLQRWNTATATRTITGPVSHRWATCTAQPPPPATRAQHHSPTTKRRNGCVRTTEAPEPDAQTHTIEPNQWQKALGSTCGEQGAASQTEQKHTIATLRFTSLQIHTHAQHARGALFVLTVCLQCTTQQPLYGTHTHSHRCAQTSLAVHKTAGRHRARQ
jgi:hypothetical protein